MSLYKPGKNGVYWCDVTVRVGGKEYRKKLSCRTTSKGEALAFEAKVRNRMLAKAGDSRRPPFFCDFADEFLSTYAMANNKPSEVASKKNSLDKHLKPAFGHLRLNEIGAEQIEKYKAVKLSGEYIDFDLGNLCEPIKSLSPKSINNHLICLAKLFAVAVEWGKLERAPKVKLLKVGETDFDFLDFAEADRLQQAAVASGSHWYTMILMALRAGLRIGELIALQWSDVDLKAGAIMVRRGAWKATVGTPKGGKPKPIPISTQLRSALVGLSSQFAGGLVFPAPPTPKRAAVPQRMLSREQCHRPLAQACKRAGLRRVGWHVLRHTFCSHLAIRGVPLKTIQELARHQQIAMTLRYAHLSQDVREDAINLLDGESDDTGKKVGRG